MWRPPALLEVATEKLRAAIQNKLWGLVGNFDSGPSAKFAKFASVRDTIAPTSVDDMRASEAQSQILVYLAGIPYFDAFL